MIRFLAAAFAAMVSLGTANAATLDYFQEITTAPSGATGVDFALTKFDASLGTLNMVQVDVYFDVQKTVIGSTGSVMCVDRLCAVSRGEATAISQGTWTGLLFSGEGAAKKDETSCTPLLSEGATCTATATARVEFSKTLFASTLGDLLDFQGAGTANFHLAFDDTLNSASVRVTYGYIPASTVPAVPLPASLPLMLGGLAVLRLGKRRKS